MDGALDLVVVTHVRWGSVPRRAPAPLTLNSSELGDPGGVFVGIPNDCPARFMLGAISLSNSSHFAPKPCSYDICKPVAVAAGARQALDETGADRIGR